MALHLFNTMTQSKDPFVAQDDHVRMYVCGVTPYDTAHLGHAFVFSTFDTLVRLLRASSIDVTYTQNVTDIDDPLFERAERDHIPFDELARRETERFVREMKAINVATPTHFVRASEELPAMFDLIQRLLDGGFAYTNDGWIYFDTSRDPAYGALAEAAGFHGYDALLNEANEHGNNPADPRKRHPLDFLMWRGATPGEPSWPSPWGAGRPGWHIECSAMASHYLGPQIDIHGGGTDLIFPHHSSEIAQTESATGLHPYVRVWMHVGMVSLEGEKMSKSKGNLTIVGHLLEEFSPVAVRVLLTMHHYREPWEYFRPDMERAQTLAQTLIAAASGEGGGATAAFALFSIAQHFAPAAEFLAAMEDDLNLPRALQVMERVANALLADTMPYAETASARASLHAMGNMLGLRLGN